MIRGAPARAPEWTALPLPPLAELQEPPAAALGRAAADRGDWGSAARAFSEAAAAWLYLEDPLRAADALERANRAADASGDASLRAEIAKLRGELAAKRSQRGAAMDWFERALAAIDESDLHGRCEIVLEELALAPDEALEHRLSDLAARLAESAQDRTLAARALLATARSLPIDERLAVLERARSLTASGVSSIEAWRAWAALGAEEYELDRYDLARRSLERTLELLPAERWKESLRARGMLAACHAELGDYDEAAKLATGLIEEAHAHGFARDDVATLGLLENIHYRLGEYAEVHRTARAVYELARGGVAQEARITEALAFEKEGAWEFGLALGRRVIEDEDARGADGDRGTIARALQNVGRIEREHGSKERALADHRRALELARALHSDPLVASSIDGIAEDEMALGDLALAQQDASTAIAELERSESLDAPLFGYATLAKLAVIRGDRAVLGEFCERARVRLGRLEPSRLGRVAKAGVRSHFSIWGEFEEERVRLELSAGAGSTSSAAERGFERAEDWRGRMLLEAICAGGAPAQLSCDTVERALEQGAALIEFVEARQTLGAYVLSPEGLRRIEIPERAEVERRAQLFATALARRESRPSAAEIAESGGWLYQRLLAPCLAALPSRPSTLIVVPSSALASLPFEALVVDSSRARAAPKSQRELVFVIDQFDVGYAPSASVFLELAARPREVALERGALFGDAEYQRPAHGDLPRRVDSPSEAALPQLPWTRDEVHDIAAYFFERAPDTPPSVAVALTGVTTRRISTVAGPNFDLCVGPDATLERFRQRATGATVIHCAVHGKADLYDPRRSRLYFSRSASDDGVLDAEAIANRLHLSAALVVLTACDTASGPVQRGEGVQSLAHAFLAAHAAAVIASLWDVEDPIGHRLAVDFYERWLQHREPTLHALSEAKRQLRREGRQRTLGDSLGDADDFEPYFWAPYVFVGASTRIAASARTR